MRSRRRRRSYGTRVPVVLVVFGIWGIVFGLFLTYLAIDLLTFMDATADSSGEWIVADIIWPLQMLYEGGILALGGGSLLMAIGCALVVVSS